MPRPLPRRLSAREGTADAVSFGSFDEALDYLASSEEARAALEEWWSAGDAVQRAATSADERAAWILDPTESAASREIDALRPRLTGAAIALDHALGTSVARYVRKIKPSALRAWLSRRRARSSSSRLFRCSCERWLELDAFLDHRRACDGALGTEGVRPLPIPPGPSGRRTLVEWDRMTTGTSVESRRGRCERCGGERFLIRRIPPTCSRCWDEERRPDHARPLPVGTVASVAVARGSSARLDGEAHPGEEEHVAKAKRSWSREAVDLDEARLRELVETDTSWRKIGEALGCSTSTAHKRARALGIEKRDMRTVRAEGEMAPTPQRGCAEKAPAEPEDRPAAVAPSRTPRPLPSEHAAPETPPARSGSAGDDEINREVLAAAGVARALEDLDSIESVANALAYALHRVSRRLGGVPLSIVRLDERAGTAAPR